MALISDTDRLYMLQALGEQITLFPNTGADRSIWALYDSVYTEVGDGYGAVSTRTPSLLCRDVDVQNVEIGTELIRNSITYTVSKVEQDAEGEGTTRLFIHK